MGKIHDLWKTLGDFWKSIKEMYGLISFSLVVNERHSVESPYIRSLCRLMYKHILLSCKDVSIHSDFIFISFLKTSKVHLRYILISEVYSMKISLAICYMYILIKCNKLVWGLTNTNITNYYAFCYLLPIY